VEAAFNLAFSVTITLLAFCVIVILLTWRSTGLYPAGWRRPALAALWIRTHIFPPFWRWLDPLVTGVVMRFLRWWERDPAEKRGE